MSVMKIRSMGSLVEEYLEELRTRGPKPEIPISTLPSLNDDLWGIRKKKLTVIGARTSQGKSAFAIQLALDAAFSGAKVLFLSLEMENMECIERVLTNMNRINNYTLRTNAGMKYEQQIRETGKRLLNKKLFISDCLGKTWEEIDQIVEMEGSNIDAVFVDYIQNTKQKGSRTQKEGYDEYIRHLREMAIRKNFACVILSQINRSSMEGRDNRPRLHNLKGTGFLEEHADIIMLLFWPFKHNPSLDMNYFEIDVAKNKLGQTRVHKVKFYPQYSLFEESDEGLSEHQMAIKQAMPDDSCWEE